MKPIAIALLLSMTVMAKSDWVPPLQPDPEKILQEARQDTRDGYFVDALAKFVWFHENALKFTPSLVGVRLSFALSDWYELGVKYPPALVKMREIRDATETSLREEHGTAGAFADVAAINGYLRQDEKTKDLFVWLDANKPRLAQEVFDSAEPALIKAKEYHLCDRYIEADHDYQNILDAYRMRMGSRGAQTQARIAKLMQNMFSREVATLVALLKINGKEPDAKRIAAQALHERDDPEFKELLDKALEGTLPKQR